jgi:hypothetical protein
MVWESPKAYPKRVTSRSRLDASDNIINSFSSIQFVGQPYGFRFDTYLRDIPETWRAGLTHQSDVVSAVEGRSVREVEVTEVAVEDEADQTRPPLSQRVTKKGVSLQNASSRSD